MMLTKGFWVLALLLCGLAPAAYAQASLLVVGQRTLTPATVPAGGYASISVAPGGELTILTALGQPLTINAQGSVAIGGVVRVRAVNMATTPPTPTPHGGEVIFNAPNGVFAIGPTGAIIASVLNATGEAAGNGGEVTVRAAAIDIAGAMIADGSLTNAAARGGVIDLAAQGSLTLQNQEGPVSGSLATLSAKGYRGGIIRLRTQTGAVALETTSLVDVRGIVGAPFTTADLRANVSLIVIESGNGAVLNGFRLYGVDTTVAGIGHLYVAARGPITVNPLPEALLQVAEFAEYAELADTNLGAPAGHFAGILLTATHLGDVLFRANYNGPLDISASNAAIIEDARIASNLTAKVAGYLLLLDGRAGQRSTISASRLQRVNYLLPSGSSVRETGATLSFAGDTFAAGEVYATPCPLKLSGGSIGDSATIACEGALTLTGVDVGDNVSLEAGAQFALDFTRPLKFVSEILKITGGEMGNGLIIIANRPPDDTSTKALNGSITGTEFGDDLQLTLAGSLKATGIEVGDNYAFEILGDLRLTGGDFGTGTIHYTGARRVTGTDGNITFINP